MACVIERHGTEIKDGRIIHDDRPATYEQAEKIAGRRLDRRKSYAIIDGQVAESCIWSQACSGCYSGHDLHLGIGNGCSECGHTGRRRNGQWVPLATANAKLTGLAPEGDKS